MTSRSEIQQSIYCLTVLLFVCFNFVSTVRDRSISSSSGSCHEASQIFQSKGIGHASEIPLSQINGEELKICKSKKSCCTPEIENMLKNNVGKEFTDIMQASTSHIKNLIGTDTAKFKESFLSMVRLSENNTQALFAGMYESMVATTRQSIKDLYSSLVSYLLGRTDINLDKSVNGFFDEIFPSVYHKMINPRLPDLSASYVQCLKDSRRQIAPFGDIPNKVSEHITKSVKTAYILLEALNIGIEVINTTDYSLIYEECSKHLTKLIYCPHCRLGMVGAKPCNGYCLNVVRGCLVNIAELDQPWNDYVTAMTSMTSQMKGIFSVEESLSSLDNKISEAIMNAVDQGPDINKQVEKMCENEGRALPSAEWSFDQSLDVGNLKSSKARTKRSNLGGRNFFSRIESFMKSLSQSKGFYSTLADNICSDDNLSRKSHETNCWNGHSIGEYTEIIAGVGVDAQKYNPEVRYQRLTDVTIARLKDKLIHTRNNLHSQINTKPESDSFTVNSGSGYHYNNWLHEDDEDYSLSSSGSGSKDIDFEDSFTKESPSTTLKPPVADNSASVSHISAIVVIVGIIATFVLPLKTVCDS